MCGGKGAILAIAVSAAFIAFPFVLYRAWKTRNQGLFNLCLGFASLLAVWYVFVIMTYFQIKSDVRKAKNNVMDRLQDLHL